MGTDAFRSKVVVENISPAMQHDELVERLLPWSAAIDYLRFHPGKIAAPFSARQPRAAWACVNFTSAEALLAFSEAAPAALSCGPHDSEWRVAVRLAPHQAVPAPHANAPVDPLMGTLEEDEEYRAFVAGLARAADVAVSLERQYEAMMAAERELKPWKYGKDPAVHSTPLLEHLCARAAQPVRRGGAPAARDRPEKAARSARSDQTSRPDSADRPKKSRKSRLKKKGPSASASAGAGEAARPAARDAKKQSQPPHGKTGAASAPAPVFKILPKGASLAPSAAQHDARRLAYKTASRSAPADM